MRFSKRKATGLMPVITVILTLFITLLTILATTSIASYAVEGDGQASGLDAVISAEAETEEKTVKPSNLPDSDTLLEMYIEGEAEAVVEEAMMGATTDADADMPARSARYWKLGDAEKKAYLKIREMLENIAHGDSDDAEIKLTYEELFSNDVLGTWYSASDLGIESVINSSTWEISKDAIDAVMKKYPINTAAIMNALSRDYPQLLYWFDKTAGMSSGTATLVSATYEGGEWKIRCSEDSLYSFGFHVAGEYQIEVKYASNIDAGYIVDTELTSSVASALGYAAEIVADAYFLPDYDKLAKYKDVICSEVDYNTAATCGASYGNPWQMVYVFDKDPATNVVCEGYSKAFKFLCDLTSFDDKSIACSIATGQMGGGTGAGGHMWNIVSMEGLNYLVDVTNCDSGTIGYPDKLFMKGNSEYAETTVTDNENSYSSETYTFPISSRMISYTYDADTVTIFDREERLLASADYDSNHVHEWDEGVVTTEAGCVDAGIKTYTCISCNAVRTEEIPATGHKEVSIPAVDATCTEAGLTEGIKCAICGEVIKEQSEVPALGHDYGAWTMLDDALHQRICSHDSGHVEKAVHVFDEGVITKQATTSEEGIRTYTCKVCGAVKTETIEKLIDNSTQGNKTDESKSAASDNNNSAPGASGNNNAASDNNNSAAGTNENNNAAAGTDNKNNTAADNNNSPSGASTKDAQGMSGADEDNNAATENNNAAAGTNENNSAAAGTNENNNAAAGTDNKNNTAAENNNSPSGASTKDAQGTSGADEDNNAATENNSAAAGTNENNSAAAGTDNKNNTAAENNPSTPAVPITKEANPLGEGASAADAEIAILGSTSEEGPSGSFFAPLSLRSASQGNANIKLTWNKVPKAKKYVIYGNACGKKNKMKYLGSTAAKTFNVKKIDKKLKKATYHKFIVVAVDGNNSVVTTSKVIHVATKGGKFTNPKTLMIKSGKKAVKALTIKKGKSIKLSSSVTKAAAKLTLKSHRKVAYESSNLKVATVNGKGKVTAKKKGTCYIYAYTQNGVFKKIKVTVK